MVDKLRQLGAKHRSFELGTGDLEHPGNHGAGMNLGAGIRLQGNPQL